MVTFGEQGGEVTESRAYRTAIGSVIHDLRQERARSLGSVAEAIGITTAHLSKIESGRLLPSVAVMPDWT